MTYLYGLTDTKFKQQVEPKKLIKASPIKFRRNPLLERQLTIISDESPLICRSSPPTLLELCLNIIDKLPFGPIYDWNDRDVRQWIHRYGYPQYSNTFRVNMIGGRKLLLLDADALSAMNIKDFDHIKHITYGIRMLFHFELTKFSNSISLPDEKPNELYLLWHTQTGIYYDEYRRSDLYIRMQIIRDRSQSLDHWELLELWLHRERKHKYKELFALVPRFNMYNESSSRRSTRSQFSNDPVVSPPTLPDHDSNFSNAQLPWRLTCLNYFRPMSTIHWTRSNKECSTCIPPCECGWPPGYYVSDTVIGCLKHRFPEKFAHIYEGASGFQLQESLMMRWTRFSF
ncbi:uncharacterized protein LOC115482811 [Drosophila hydei]|uniref:Uncharacterized protein LOC111604939 n=1 Tax=Drosophila hydei TaxID=7224 RepID=A0A6J1MIQ1_DROHY|nr:uncharacterized protein LOC111604939 [Drosophila hydei]XP_030078835.1 uncharacterized protein LOC115482811 [Drosophila hydei]